MKTKRNNRPQKTTKTKRSQPAQSNSPTTLTEHLGELRRRLLWLGLIIIVIGACVYAFHDFFVRLAVSPLGQQKLIYLSPTGGFNFIFSVTLYVTLIITMPVILYQVYAFIRPAIPQHSRRLSLGVGIAATLLMACGVAFGYLFAIPAGLNFLTNFADQYVTSSLTAEAYLKFILAYVLGIGILFQVPLLLILLHRIRPLTPKGLLKSERYTILAAFVVGAVVSPSPDIIGQAIIAVPIIVLYQFGVVAVLVSIYRQRRGHDKSKPAFSPHTAPVMPAKTAKAPLPNLVAASHPKQSSALVVSPQRRSVDGIMMQRSRSTPQPRSIIVPVRPLSGSLRTNGFNYRRQAVIDIVR